MINYGVPGVSDDHILGILWTATHSLSRCTSLADEHRRPTQEAMMARDIAVAALVAFSAGVMCGVIVTTMLVVRSKGRRNSTVGLSLDLLEIKLRRFMGSPVHGSSAHIDG
jgi:hypothetical protein